MSDQEINIAIAEACGWKRLATPGAWISPRGRFHYPPEQTITDYLKDLNAMHEAENNLTPAQKYANLRFIAPDWKDWTDGKAYLKITYATARQRAEAFLRTLGKWKD